MVAWRCDQHSPMFGQAASSHTVTRRLSRISARVSWKTGWVGALTLIQSGLRRIGLSGRFAFSGWRWTAAPPSRRSTTMRVAMRDGPVRSALDVDHPTVGIKDGLVGSEERRVGKECRSRRAPYHL